MRLMTVHKITIGSAIVGIDLFALWSAWMWSRHGGLDHAATAAAAVAAGVGLTLYLRNLIRRQADSGGRAPSDNAAV